MFDVIVVSCINIYMVRWRAVNLHTTEDDKFHIVKSNKTANKEQKKLSDFFLEGFLIDDLYENTVRFLPAYGIHIVDRRQLQRTCMRLIARHKFGVEWIR